MGHHDTLSRSLTRIALASMGGLLIVLGLALQLG